MLNLDLKNFHPPYKPSVLEQIENGIAYGCWIGCLAVVFTGLAIALSFI